MSDEFPRLIVLFPGILVKVNSQEELDRMFAADVRAMKWGVFLGICLAAVIGVAIHTLT